METCTVHHSKELRHLILHRVILPAAWAINKDKCRPIIMLSKTACTSKLHKGQDGNELRLWINRKVGFLPLFRESPVIWIQVNQSGYSQALRIILLRLMPTWIHLAARIVGAIAETSGIEISSGRLKMVLCSSGINDHGSRNYDTLPIRHTQNSSVPSRRCMSVLQPHRPRYNDSCQIDRGTNLELPRQEKLIR